MTLWRCTGSCLSVRLSVLWQMRSKTFTFDFPLVVALCGFVTHSWPVHTGTPPQPSWTLQSAWRRQRSRECTARQPRSFLASTCSTQSHCRTTTPCCPAPPWRTTVPVRTDSRLSIYLSSVYVCVTVNVSSHEYFNLIFEK